MDAVFADLGATGNSHGYGTGMMAMGPDRGDLLFNLIDPAFTRGLRAGSVSDGPDKTVADASGCRYSFAQFAPCSDGGARIESRCPASARREMAEPHKQPEGGARVKPSAWIGAIIGLGIGAKHIFMDYDRAGQIPWVQCAGITVAGGVVGLILATLFAGEDTKKERKASNTLPAEAIGER